MTRSNDLEKALRDGSLLVRDYGHGRFMWMWTKKTMNGYTRYFRRGWASMLGTIEDELIDIRRNPEMWEVVLTATLAPDSFEEPTP
jgi:hypothetical protein